MQKAIFFTIILGLLLFSCKKENKEATTNLTEIKADSVAGMPIDTIHTGDSRKPHWIGMEYMLEQRLVLIVKV